MSRVLQAPWFPTLATISSAMAGQQRTTSAGCADLWHPPRAGCAAAARASGGQRHTAGCRAPRPLRAGRRRRWWRRPQPEPVGWPAPWTGTARQCRDRPCPSLAPGPDASASTVCKSGATWTSSALPPSENHHSRQSRQSYYQLSNADGALIGGHGGANECVSLHDTFVLPFRVHDRCIGVWLTLSCSPQGHPALTPRSPQRPPAYASASGQICPA